MGKQVELRDFPINVAVDPSGRFAAVLHGGYSRHQILIVDIQAARVVSNEELNQAFMAGIFARWENALLQRSG